MTPILNIKRFSNPEWHQREGPTRNLIKGEQVKTPKHKNYYKYALKKVPPKQGEKETNTVYQKTYNRCKWHKSQAENDPEGKGYNGWRLQKKLEEEHNSDRQGYAHALKSILIDLN